MPEFIGMMNVRWWDRWKELTGNDVPVELQVNRLNGPRVPDPSNYVRENLRRAGSRCKKKSGSR